MQEKYFLILIIYLQNLYINRKSKNNNEERKNSIKNYPVKNNDKRVFGKEISNALNNTNINYLLDAKNKKTQNISNDTKYNKYKKNFNINSNINNINIIKNKNKENIINNKNNNINIINNQNNENINNVYINKNKKKYKSNDINKNKANIISNNLELKFSFKVEYKKNPIEEYDEIIMKNLFTQEIINRPDYRNLLNLSKEEKDILKRYSCINMAISLCETFELRQETFYLSINIFDRYIHKIKIINDILPKINPKLIMLTCVFISSKYEEIYPPFIDEYLQLFSNIFKNDIIKTEKEILSKLNFELHICSSYLFLTKFFEKIEKNDIMVLHAAQFILDLCLISIEFCSFKPSFQAAICIYLAKKFLSFNGVYKIKIWSADNEFITGYSEEEIKRELKFVVKIIKDFFIGKIIKEFNKTSLYKKYCEKKYSNIANIFKDICLKNK